MRIPSLMIGGGVCGVATGVFPLPESVTLVAMSGGAVSHNIMYDNAICNKLSSRLPRFLCQKVSNRR